MTINTPPTGSCQDDVSWSPASTAAGIGPTECVVVASGATVCGVWVAGVLLTAAAEVVTAGEVVVVAGVVVACVVLAVVELVVVEVAVVLFVVVVDDVLDVVVVNGLLLVVTVSVVVLPVVVARAKTSADLPQAGEANTSKRPAPRVSIEAGRVTFRMDGRVGVPGLLAMMRPPGGGLSAPEPGHRSPIASRREDFSAG
jgi:hypothetical protein